MSNDSDAWFVIVSASIHWHNYRHLGNALAIYQQVRRSGVPDSRIIFLNALNSPCNSRNLFSGVYKSVSDNEFDKLCSIDTGNYSLLERIGDQRENRVLERKALKRDFFTCLDEVEYDYIGADVTVENFVGILLGVHPVSTPHRKRLHSNANSSVVVFLSGHGGDGFFKFRDKEEISATELFEIVLTMNQYRRYNKLLFVADTCQAQTLGENLKIPNFAFIGSSLRGENSYAANNDESLGVALIDRFSLKFNDILDKHIRKREKRIPESLKDVEYLIDSKFTYSHTYFQSTDDYKLDDFFKQSIIRSYAIDGDGLVSPENNSILSVIGISMDSRDYFLIKTYNIESNISCFTTSSTTIILVVLIISLFLR